MGVLDAFEIRAGDGVVGPEATILGLRLVAAAKKRPGVCFLLGAHLRINIFKEQPGAKPQKSLLN